MPNGTKSVALTNALECNNVCSFRKSGHRAKAGAETSRQESWKSDEIHWEARDGGEVRGCIQCAVHTGTAPQVFTASVLRPVACMLVSFIVYQKVSLLIYVHARLHNRPQTWWHVLK